MKILVLFLAVFLSACASSPVRVEGGLAVSMSSKDYAAMRQAEADANAAAEYYKAKAAQYANVTDPTAQVAMRAFEALDQTDKAPTNGNDVLIAREQQKTIRSQNRWNATTGLVTRGLGVGGAVYAAGKLADLGKAAIERDTTSTNIVNNADNGSTIKGAVGDSNTYTESSEVASTSDGENMPSSECTDRTVQNEAEASELVDQNQDGIVCEEDETGIVRDNDV